MELISIGYMAKNDFIGVKCLFVFLDSSIAVLTGKRSIKKNKENQAESRSQQAFDPSLQHTLFEICRKDKGAGGKNLKNEKNGGTYATLGF
jgi:hypothetical protein